MKNIDLNECLKGMNIPGGRRTTSRRLMPEFRLAIACLCNEYRNVPGSNFFLGRNVCWNKENS